MATPPRRRSATPVKDLADVPHSGLCDADEMTWPQDPRTGLTRGVRRPCVCGAGFLRMLAGAR